MVAVVEKKPASQALLSLRFTVPGKPQPKKRPRVVRLPNGASHTYTPDEHGYVPQVQVAALRALGGAARPVAAPVYLSLLVHRRMPKGWSGRQRDRMTGQLTVTRPDPVNIAMQFCDALSGYCWNDDSQVHIRFCEARWADRDEVCVEVQEVGQ